MMDWQPVDTIPLDRVVQIKSATGIICLAKCSYGERYFRNGYVMGSRTVKCWRKDLPSGYTGDICAAAWRDAP